MHEYLVMKIDYCKKGKVKIDMTDYLKKILDDFPDKYQGEAITPAANHLFEVNGTERNLSKMYAQAFHTIRGYIPKVFYFKNPYPLNPEKSDLFYFLLIRTKRPKSPKLQRAVSSSSALHAIKRIRRDTTY